MSTATAIEAPLASRYLLPDLPFIVYEGQRGPGDLDTRVTVAEFSRRRMLEHVIYHSPTGLEWGYGGSGPADLALSILADYFGERPTRRALELGEPRAWKLHQAFKWRFIATAEREGFRIKAQQIADWLWEREANGIRD